MSKPSRKAKPPTPATAKHGYDGRFKPGTKTVADPYDGKPLHVACNARHDPLESLYVRKRINEAQKRAGDRVAALCVRSAGEGVKGIDYADDRVDGGPAWKDIPTSRMEAAQELGLLSRAVGKLGYAVLIRVVGDGFEIQEVAKLWSGNPKPSKMERDYVSKTLQDALSEAAVYYGFQSDQSGPSARVMR